MITFDILHPRSQIYPRSNTELCFIARVPVPFVKIADVWERVDCFVTVVVRTNLPGFQDTAFTRKVFPWRSQ